MAIPYKGQHILLQGIPTSMPQHLLLHIAPVPSGDQDEYEVVPPPVELQALLQRVL